MATTNGGAFTVIRESLTVSPGGVLSVVLDYVGSSGQHFTRTLFVDAAGAQVVDQLGNVIATPAPSALMTALSSFLSWVDTTIANGASAGKLNL